MRRAVEGFVHRPGMHSISSALRDILESNGFRFTEEIVFGLDCGLSFMYWRSKDAFPPVLIGGRSTEGVREACQILGIKVERRTSDSVEKAWREVRGVIDSDSPVMLRVDLHYLDYLKPPPEIHFGRYAIVASGYDEEKGEVYVWDCRFEGVQTISLDSLSKARGSTFRPFPPENTWYSLTFPSSLTKLEGAIRIAIRENVRTFLDPTVRNAGLKGINYFAEQVIKWTEILTESDLRLALRFTHLLIEGVENGTGLLRRLYSGFLRESSRILDDKRLDETADILERSAECWTQVAKILLKSEEADIGRVPQSLSQAREKILQCYDLEKKAFELLESRSESWISQL